MVIFGYIELNKILLKFLSNYIFNIANKKFKIESLSCIALVLGNTSVKYCNLFNFLVVGYLGLII